MVFKSSGLRRDMSPVDVRDLHARKWFTRIVPLIVEDERRREEASKEVRVLNLATRPETRADRVGSVSTGLYHVPAGQEPVFDDLRGNVGRAYVERSAAQRMSYTGRSSDYPEEALFRRLDKGSTVTVLGQEHVVRRKNGRTGQWFSSREFEVVKVAEGVHDMAAMKAMRIGGPAERLADAAAAYDRAGTEAEKDAIVRSHLGQPAGPASTAALPKSKGPDEQAPDDVDAVLFDMVKGIGGSSR